MKKCPICHSIPLSKEVVLTDQRLCINNETPYLTCSTCRSFYQKNPINEKDLEKHLKFKYIVILLKIDKYIIYNIIIYLLILSITI